MKIHTVTQVEYDDGSMSRPFTSVQVYDQPTHLELTCLTGLGISYSSDQLVQAQSDSTIRFRWELADPGGFLNKITQLDLCFEQEPALLKHMWTKDGVIAFQTPGNVGVEQEITFVLVDKYGASSNRVKFNVRIV